MYSPGKYSRNNPNRWRKLPNNETPSRSTACQRSVFFGVSRVMKELCLPSAIMVCLLATMASCKTAQIQGSVATCLREGELVSVPGISSDPCITCVCQMGEVSCSRQQCPSNEGCHMILFDKPRDQCCERCKGCVHEGVSYSSGDTWTDKADPCKIYMCQAGVLTVSIKRCHVTCKDPILLTGHCCPVCRGCYVNNVYYREGQVFPSPLDPCSTCVCQNGSSSCSRELCPVINCVKDHQYYPLGSCCPKCKGSRHIYPPPGGKCLYQRRVYENGSQLTPDVCTQCTCNAGTLACERKSCPILSCATDYVIHDNSTCCPTCKHNKLRCKLYGKKYPHGAVWRHDVCIHCVCDDGVVRCQTETCSNIIECPNNTRLKMVPGQCCPQCVDDGAICSVFGDPHYRTFDGRVFNFQGTCDYILTQTRDNKELTVIVRNDARLNDHYAWTKAIRMQVGGAKIYFLQKNRVKVNRKRVTLPYVHRRSKFSIVTDGRMVALKTPSGIKVSWDGDSYLEVYVPRDMKNMMRGLCGNYNNDKSDDFIGRGGAFYVDAEQFANTWLTATRRCQHPLSTSVNTQTAPCLHDPVLYDRARRPCMLLYSKKFERCRNTHQVEPYFSSCLTDMCECGNKSHCFCVSLLAYARACKLIGYDIERYLPRQCKGGGTCPRGAVWQQCASPCPRTCENSHQVACNDPCEPGCQCPDDLVLHRNKCIPAHKCPKSSVSTTTGTNKHKPKRKRLKKKKYNSPLDFLIENK